MNLLERLFVACLRAVDVWFSTVWDAPHIDVQDRLEHGQLGQSYDEPDSLDVP